MAAKTKLDELVEQGVELTRELELLDADRKLSYVAFLKEALAIAGITEKRIGEVQKILAVKPGTDSIRRFVRRLAMEFRETRFPRPFDDPSKAARIYGSPELGDEMAQQSIKVGEIQCVAVLACKERFGKEVFGGVTDWRGHQKKTLEARQRLDLIYEQMPNAQTGEDVTYTDAYPAVLPSEKKGGLCKVTFNKWPSLSPSMGDWRRLMILEATANPPKSKRQRLTKAA